MPYTLRKLPNKNKWKVVNKKTKQVYARSTTRTKALRQIKLLNAIDHGFKPKKMG
jgi:hypothetical protein